MEHEEQEDCSTTFHILHILVLPHPTKEVNGVGTEVEVVLEGQSSLVNLIQHLVEKWLVRPQ